MKYKAIAKCSYELSVEVEAASHDEALKMINEADPEDFKEIDGSGEWELIDVQIDEKSIWDD